MNRSIVDSFKARSTDGKEFDLIVYQEWVDESSMRNPYGKTPGLKTIETSGGHNVNPIDAQTFEIVELQLVVHRVGS